MPGCFNLMTNVFYLNQPHRYAWIPILNSNPCYFILQIADRLKNSITVFLLCNFKIIHFVYMPIKQIDYGSKEYMQMVGLRNDILRKPLKLTFQEGELEKEKDDILIGAFDEDKILGCCLLTRIDKDCVRLRQMAVQNNLQGKGIGAAMMNFAENVARDRGYKTLIMHARKTAIGFYEKSGYKVIGDEFEEVRLPHFVMEKKLKIF
jgi:N-acetylglutamate synthase-like GNAT family acetyltransferase